MSFRKGLIFAGGILALSQLAFHPTIRREMFRRAGGECQCGNCIGHLIQGNVLSFRTGFNMNCAHYPDMHQPREDFDISHGRLISSLEHIKEEIERGNHKGVQLLYEKQTIMNKHWLADHGWRDIRPPLQMLYDWAETPETMNEVVANYFKQNMGEEGWYLG